MELHLTTKKKRNLCTVSRSVQKDAQTMNCVRRTPSKSFCGILPSVERKKDERYVHVKTRKFSVANIPTCKIHRAPVLRRASSLPDCNEMASMHMNKTSRKSSLLSNSNSMKRTRSVSFAPEVLFLAAVADNDITELQRIIHKREIDFNQQSPSGLTAMHYAAAEGSFECLKLLIDNGAYVDVWDYQGCSPLDFAVRGGHFDCASYLIKAGAEIKKIVNGLK